MASAVFTALGDLAVTTDDDQLVVQRVRLAYVAFLTWTKLSEPIE